MYRADATVDIGQTEERFGFGRECESRGEEVGEVRICSSKHEVPSVKTNGRSLQNI
jgi:hypothetical protein